MNENKPGIGGMLAHGACCGGPLLILLFVKFPSLLLYGGGLAIGGGVIFWANRAWSRRRRYREALLKRHERKGSFPGGIRHFLLRGAARTSNNSASPKAERVA